MKSFIILIQIAVVVLSFVRCSESCESVQKPNIIYILADDMGYGDLKSLNPDSHIETPNMDKIVNNGVHFTDAHTNSSVCTPTRYGVLTGRYAFRSRLKEGVLWGYSTTLINKDRVTVPSFLRDNGYETACIGKWHLGLDWVKNDESLPIEDRMWNAKYTPDMDDNVNYAATTTGNPNTVGFDYSYIIPASLDMPPYLYVENGKATSPAHSFTEGKSEKVDGRGVFWRAGKCQEDFDFFQVLPNFVNKACTYIGEKAKTEKPFFLYLPLPAPHTPWIPTDAYKGASNAGTYGDFVTMVDDMIGKVVAQVEAEGIAENTLIIVTSDNGSHWKDIDIAQWKHRANYIYKGQKADIYEAGHRVPYIAQWKGVIPVGHKSDELMCTTDLLATVAGIIGQPLPENAGADSYNLWSAYKGQVKAPLRESVIHHSLYGFFSLRKGDWKYTPYRGSGGFTQPNGVKKPAKGLPAITLYNINEDPQELNNLYDDNLQMAAEMDSQLEQYKKLGCSREGYVENVK